MGVRILFDDEQNDAALYCSTTGVAFGPVLHGDRGGQAADERLEAFLRWLPLDARQYSEAELAERYATWLGQEADQRTREQQARDAKFVAWLGEEA